jgi:hypothetical protein
MTFSSRPRRSGRGRDVGYATLEQMSVLFTGLELVVSPHVAALLRYQPLSSIHFFAICAA